MGEATADVSESAAHPESGVPRSGGGASPGRPRARRRLPARPRYDDRERAADERRGGPARPRRAGDDQADRPQPAGARCAEGRRDRPLRRRRHGLRPADLRPRPPLGPSRPSLPDPASRGGGGRGHAPGLLDRLQRRESRRGRAGGGRPRPRAGADRPHPGARRYLLFRPRRGLRRGRGGGRGRRARPHAGRALRGAHHLPRPTLRPGLGRSPPDAQSHHPARGSVAACAGRAGRTSSSTRRAPRPRM